MQLHGPDKLGTDTMAVDGMDGRLHRHSRERRKEGEEPVSTHQIQRGCGE